MDINGKTVYETVAEFAAGRASVKTNLNPSIYLINAGLGKKKLVVQ